MLALPPEIRPMNLIQQLEQEQVEKLIADRPIATLASAFAVGVVVAFILKRH